MSGRSVNLTTLLLGRLSPAQENVFRFSYLSDRVCSNFSGAGKFCLAHGLKVTSVVCLQMTLTSLYENL